MGAHRSSLASQLYTFVGSVQFVTAWQQTQEVCGRDRTGQGGGGIYNGKIHKEERWGLGSSLARPPQLKQESRDLVNDPF